MHVYISSNPSLFLLDSQPHYTPLGLLGVSISMDSLHRIYNHHRYQSLPLMKNQQQLISNRTPSSPSPDTSSPILVIAILGIIITAFLLLSYYVFVIKCWLNLHRIGFLRRFSTSQMQRYEDPLVAYEPTTTENRGVDESVIRAIPIFQFMKGVEKEGQERAYYECAVCLNEFQDEEKLRLLPSCTHAFHIDCIDIWLQSNANCPLCRSSISTTIRLPSDQIIAPSTSPQDQSSVIDTPISGDEDYVVIEVSGDTNADQIIHRRRELAKSRELLEQAIRHSPRKLVHKKARKFHNVSSMGDECIDIRCKDEQFSVQPMRRSFSMDSSTDQQLFLAVQEIIQHNRQHNEVSPSEGCSTSSRVRRSIFSFSHGRGSKNTVIPIRFEP